MTASRTILLALTLATISVFDTAGAQDLAEFRQQRGGNVAFFEFWQPGDVTLRVKVWGAVRNPGLYEVRRGVRLSDLFTLSGGVAAAERDTRTHSTTRVRLARQSEGQVDIIFSVTMENELDTFPDDPVLQDGDTVMVETVDRPRFTWRDLLPLVSTAASLILLADRVVR